MNREKAFEIISRQTPCGHEDCIEKLGDGHYWCRCDGCGATIALERLDEAKKRVQEFEEVLDVLRGSPRIIAVHLYGGMFDAIIADEPMDDIQVVVYDYDIEDADADDIIFVPQKESRPVKAVGYLSEIYKAGICIEAVEQQLIEKEEVEFQSQQVDPWAEHPDFQVADWQYEVQNGDTRRGYNEWVMAKIEERREER